MTDAWRTEMWTSTGIAWAALITAALMTTGCKARAAPQAAPSARRTVEDMTGERVEVPGHITRVACLEVLCYQKLFMLGASESVVEMTQTSAPWMVTTNPRVAAIPKVPSIPSFEELAAQNVDVVFFLYDLAATRKKLAALNIPGIVSQPAGVKFATQEEFAESNRRALRLFAQVMGGDATRQRAEDWCTYYDEKIRYVTSRTARIPRQRRPRVYYLRGPDALSTQGRGSATFWYGEMSGADMVVKELPLTGKGGISMETILRWDPEVVLVGRQYPEDLVLKDPRWRTVSAVKHHRVVSTPEGVFYWDGGPESVLLMEFMAKLLHPDLFEDLDLVHELKEYYARFYRYPLTDDQAAKILQGRSPDGSRVNWMRN